MSFSSRKCKYLWQFYCIFVPLLPLVKYLSHIFMRYIWEVTSLGTTIYNHCAIMGGGGRVSEANACWGGWCGYYMRVVTWVLGLQGSVSRPTVHLLYQRLGFLQWVWTKTFPFYCPLWKASSAHSYFGPQVISIPKFNHYWGVFNRTTPVYILRYP